MQHLGGADAVQDGQPVGVVPAAPHVGRQRLGGRDAQPHRRQVAPLGARAAQHGVVERRYGEEQRRSEALDRLEDSVGDRAAAELHRRGAHPDGEGEAVAEPVGVEQLGGGQADVVLADAEHLGGVRLAGVGKVVLEVDDPLGPAGGPGAVEPERRVVAVGVGRGELAGVLGQQLREAVGALGGPADDDQLDPLGMDGQRLPDLVQQLQVDDHGLGVAVGQEVAVVVGLEQRVERDRDHPGADGPQERGHERRAVVLHQQHALLALHPERAEGAPGGAGVIEELLVGGLAGGAAQRDLGAAPGLEVAVQDRADVVEVRQGGNRGLGHRRDRHLRLTPSQCLTTSDLVSW